LRRVGPRGGAPTTVMLRRLSADTAVIIGCALTWGIALLVVFWVDEAIHLRAFAWRGWGLWPVGAFLCGVVAGLGGLVGLALSRMRPTWLGVLLPALAGLSIPFSFHWLVWWFGPVGPGHAPSETVALLPYLAEALRVRDGAAVAVLQFVGGLLGGAVTTGAILYVDACPRCHELLSPAGQLHRFVDDASQLTRMTAASLDEPSYVSMLAALEKRPTGLLWIAAFLKICKHCGMGEVVELRRQQSRGSWGRAVVRRKFGPRAPALVRWFMLPANAEQDGARAGGASAKIG
jgi:hypothetical protein